MNTEQRVQRAIEHIQEDERLRGDLEDGPAGALVAWASKRASEAAGDASRNDMEIETVIRQIRQAARTAARSGISDPGQLIEAAERLLQSAAPESIAPPPDTPKSPATGLARGLRERLRGQIEEH